MWKPETKCGRGSRVRIPVAINRRPPRSAHRVSNDRRDALLAEVYEELRAAATRIMRRDADIVTMQPTELVNEAAIRVVGIERMAFADRQHMLATCVRILRQTMIDQIRRKRAQKRQAPEVTVVLAEIGRSVDIDELGDLLERLETIAPE